MIASSAYNLIVEVIFLGKSLIYNRKSRGLKTEPCGTPEDTLHGSL